MNNEIANTVDVKVDVKISSAASAVISIAAIAGLCFCACSGMEHGYGIKLGDKFFIGKQNNIPLLCAS